MKTLPIVIFAAILASPWVPAQAIDLNPFSAIKSAVEAAIEDRSGDDIGKDLEIKGWVSEDMVGAVHKVFLEWDKITDLEICAR